MGSRNDRGWGSRTDKWMEPEPRSPVTLALAVEDPRSAGGEQCKGCEASSFVLEWTKPSCGIDDPANPPQESRGLGTRGIDDPADPPQESRGPATRGIRDPAISRGTIAARAQSHC